MYRIESMHHKGLRCVAETSAPMNLYCTSSAAQMPSSAAVWNDQRMLGTRINFGQKFAAECEFGGAAASFPEPDAPPASCCCTLTVKPVLLANCVHRSAVLSTQQTAPVSSSLI